MKKVVLVDGYNVIHSSPFLKRLLFQDLHRAQSELVKLITSWCFLKKIEGYVIFDAYTSPFPDKEEQICSLVKVVYTGEGKSADTYIEKFVAQHKSFYNYIYVITSDYSQGMTVVDKHILPLSPQNFLREIKTSQKYLKEKYFPASVQSGYYLSDRLGKETKEKLEKLRNSSQ